METTIVAFGSSLHGKERLEEKQRVILQRLNAGKHHFSVVPPAKHEAPYHIILVLTGGVENTVIQYLKGQTLPIIFLSDDKDNSLAATLELTAKLQAEEIQTEVILIDKDDALQKLERTLKILQTIQRLKNSKIGILGRPSDWLVASHINDIEVERRFGTRVIRIPLKEVITRATKVSRREAERIAETFVKGASRVVEPSKETITNAARIYISLKNMCEEYELNAFTIRCFDLLSALQTTGCMALSLLNSEGIIAGCEGDAQSLFSMYISHLATGSIPFMANISDIDTYRNSVTLAHCTVAIKMTSSYTLRSHFESGIGVGIQGDLPEGDATLLRLGKSSLESYMLFTGTATHPTEHSEELCRTQVVVNTDTSPEVLLKRPLGNHIVFLSGRHTITLEKLFEYLGMKRIND